MRYADGRIMKHSRAANFAWRCENGKYLYWFHNHGGRFILEHPNRRSMAYEDRNPVWLAGGVEVDSPKGKIIRWSQPEIALYDDDTYIRMSYPDLVEDGGKYFLTETQKDVARVHEISPTLLQGLWSQFDDVPKTIVSKPLVDVGSKGQAIPESVNMPVLPLFNQRSRRGDYGADDLRNGFTLDLWTKLASLAPGQVLLDNRTPDRKGLLLSTAENGAVELTIYDGRTENRVVSDSGVLTAGADHHVGVVVDGGPKIVTFVIDGKLNDGGTERQFGWTRFSPNLRNANGARTLQVGRKVQRLRVYGRALRTSEVIANFRSKL
jgi:hypothetical protein